MAEVELSGVGKSFGAVEVIRGIDLTIHDGEFVVFVGPSGCGKSTLLRMICGLEHVSAGDDPDRRPLMRIVDPAKREACDGVPVLRALSAHDGAENMGFGSDGRQAARREMERVARGGADLRLEELLDRLPKAAFGRPAPARRDRPRHRARAEGLPFDEPLSNLDAELRVQMRLEIAALHRALGATMIYVTHDQVEAMTMADRIVVLRPGASSRSGRRSSSTCRPPTASSRASSAPPR